LAIRDHIVSTGEAGDQALHIVVFGSSLTHRAVWTSQIGPGLVKCGFGGANVTAMGRTGAGSVAGVAMVKAYRPKGIDVAILEYAINDADIVDGLSRHDSMKNHRQMIASLRSDHPGVAIVLMATNPVSGIQRLKRPGLMAYYGDYLTLANVEGVSFFDGPARWSDFTSSNVATPDGLHPDPEIEAALYGSPLVDMIARLLGQPCGTP
jgi:lysophospholipase L1-like esterase